MVPERREVGERDQLFLNDGRGTFTEARAEEHFLDAAGRGTQPERDWGLAARFHDLNGDGLPDLWVCNDFWTPDRVWINQGRRVFREAAPHAIRSFSFSSMAVGLPLGHRASRRGARQNFRAKWMRRFAESFSLPQ